MVIPKQLSDVLSVDPEIVSGAVCFTGTRVPVQALLDTFYDGDGIDEFLEGYPSVSRQQAEAFLRWQDDQSRKMLGLELIV